jgi:hypothetical protein
VFAGTRLRSRSAAAWRGRSAVARRGGELVGLGSGAEGRAVAGAGRRGEERGGAHRRRGQAQDPAHRDRRGDRAEQAGRVFPRIPQLLADQVAEHAHEFVPHRVCGHQIRSRASPGRVVRDEGRQEHRGGMPVRPPVHRIEVVDVRQKRAVEGGLIDIVDAYLPHLRHASRGEAGEEILNTALGVFARDRGHVGVPGVGRGFAQVGQETRARRRSSRRSAGHGITAQYSGISSVCWPSTRRRASLSQNPPTAASGRSRAVAVR